MRTLALTLALSLAAATGAMAQANGSNLTLANAEGAPAKIIIDGTMWKCSSGVCISNGGASQSAERACRRVVAKLGPVNAFTWRGEAIEGDALAACNAAARG